MALFIASTAFGQNSNTINNSTITKDFVLGKFDYKTHEQFTKVDISHSSKTIYLNKDVYLAFLKMYKHAKSDGIHLKILSGTRNFKEQKAIWERKWQKYIALTPIDRANKILEYSSMPTTSRHHWGTDMDLNSFTNSYFEYGKGRLEYQWLLKHANSYGFYQVYSNKNTGRTGYNLERWHWSYMPLAKTYLDYYNSQISYLDVTGFKGADLAKALNTIGLYVNGISNKAKAFKID